MTPHRIAPPLRGALAGVSVVVTGIVAHSSGDGHLPGADGIIMMVLLAVAVGCGAAGLLRRARWATISLLLVAGQFATHFLLALTAGHGHGAADHGAAHHGHAGHAALPLDAHAAAVTTGGVEAHGIMPDTPMLICHLVATVISAVLIVGLEAAVTALFTRVVRVLVAIFRLPAGRPGWVALAAPGPEPAQRLISLGTAGTRGPPLSVSH